MVDGRLLLCNQTTVTVTVGWTGPRGGGWLDLRQLHEQTHPLVVVDHEADLRPSVRPDPQPSPGERGHARLAALEVKLGQYLRTGRAARVGRRPCGAGGKPST